MTQETLKVSRKAGFPIALPMTHWVLVRQHFAWLKTIGGVTKGMAEALTLVPEFDVTADDVQSASIDGEWKALEWAGSHSSWKKPPLYARKTIRIRASQVTGMIELLRAVAAFHVGGQLGDTLRGRANGLSNINILDQLVDAGR